MSKLNVVILAAGKGTRMYSDTPKVLHTLAGTTLLQHGLNKAFALGAEKTVVVVGHEADRLSRAVSGQPVETTVQEPQLGTAHAVQQALGSLQDDAVALILCGDVPLVRLESLERLLAPVNEGCMALLTCEVSDPGGLGRIIRDPDGEIRGIVEDRDASERQKGIREINTGIMAIAVSRLREWLPLIGNDNAQREYYLTDLIHLALDRGSRVHTVTLEDEQEAAGVNNRRQLAELERYYQRRLADELMLKGLTLRDPARFDVRGELIIGRDNEIDVNVIMVGRVTLGDRVRIGPNCILRDCEIGPGTVIHANSVIGESIVGADCDIGPFARIRPGTELEANAKVGNFVELKKTRLGQGSKINHLSYVGDSELGAGVNIGAGTITCNYDGANKYRTVIGDRVFVGSNAVLVAPVRLGDDAFVAAGSVITDDVDSGDLALARERQVNKKGWKRPRKQD